MLSRTLIIDHSNGAQVAAFHEFWKLPQARIDAIQARAAASREFDSIARQDGVVAAVQFAMGRAFKGYAA